MIIDLKQVIFGIVLAESSIQPCLPSLDFLNWYEMWIESRDTHLKF